MLHHHTRTLLTTAVTASLLAAPALAAAGDEQQGLEAVKQFTLTHNAQLIDKASELLDAVETYAEVIAAHDGDYAAAWQAEGSTLAVTIQEIREVWLDTSNEYEAIEGIVAGIPETAKYDLILDAGNPGSADEDVAEYDLTLPGGSVLERPGNLFHGITEPMFWGTEPEHVMLDADLDGNGTITRGEVLFDANLALGATQAIVYWSRELEQDMSAWVPNRDDAFTAVVTMTPTVGDYFGEWKESQFIDGEIGAFAAQSRLVDVQGIMGGCRKMYYEAISPVVAGSDAALDASIRHGFEDLLQLVEETYQREQTGERFTAEEADALGNDAQDIADRIVAMVLQAAAKNDVTIRG
ncbi:imelysin family protein [Vreelandella titanicae]|uniref:imelysin family protein n=1 Tax=Vreelandella titanicae TaxID=664683 RepID=UPI00241C29D4|nr:imelysin family protein [Halomonas titanicae]